MIVLSVATFCLESISVLRENYKGMFQGMEYFYLVWFTADFLARLCSCPSLPEFFKTFMTWVDITSVVPLYINVAATDVSDVSETLTFLFVLRLIRIFRLFRFFRTMSGMQVIGHTLRASARELFLLVLILLIPMVIFSTLVYYAEKVRIFESLKSGLALFRVQLNSFHFNFHTLEFHLVTDWNPSTTLYVIIHSAKWSGTLQELNRWNQQDWLKRLTTKPNNSNKRLIN